MNSNSGSPGQGLTSDTDKSAQYAGFDVDAWLECAEQGELDVYTCLGLSNASSCSKDTKRLLGRIAAALFMQMAVPILLLLIEVEKIPEGEVFSFRPTESEHKFRIIGGAMILYSLYSMYENCSDECRSKMLNFALEHRMSWGYCWPMLLGEFANILVGMILVFTMFICFTNTKDGTDLVLNAVAFNFLAGVDAEFVDRNAYVDAVQNFKHLTAPFKDALAKDRFKCLSRTIGGLTTLMRWLLILIGGTLSVLFIILPERYDESNIWELPWKFNYTTPLLE